jgi:hypothetical protein
MVTHASIWRRPAAIVGASLAMLALGVAGARAFNPQPEPPARYAAGITPDETMLMSVVNLGGEACDAVLSFADANGNTLASRRVTIDPDRFASFGISDATREGRVQLRPTVTPTDSECADLSATIEILDAGGHTQAMIGNP